ncbi:DEAD/DEAH box helicase [Thalassoglobus polymorphus]|uniref:DEAD-box ATP-dependent RNA helicase RhpA n=1 Tax=Thalassoglobus polymorphus TaxID=2527994 RepID=A0A517QHG5_9PLAN|nr:DEAD/DEAH box helicase [Thalassoglobus polymorphus]QDT31060.1 ATP-dependent RNA helicase RhlE [Thalassoglobus polymorphus]
MKTFAELNLIAPLQRALADENYETPTPIQAQTIPVALEGRDVLGSAQTGTGKTAAFSLPILNQLGRTNRKAVSKRPHALILAPTRELAVQIGDSIATYGRHLRLRHVLVYGGVSQRDQVRKLKRGAHILIATPGRLLDLMNQGHIELNQLECFVLDEADRMLDMGFLPDLKRIIRELPEKRQSLFFSATLPPKIIELSQSLLVEPATVDVTPEKTNVEKIAQRVLHMDRGRKQNMLQTILNGDDVEQALVFTKTKRTADMVTERLQDRDVKATSIHGNKSQNARQRALNAFKRKHVKVLVATDVAARGIDVDGITHVINYDIPLEAEAYVHRIGRTGRAGADGIAISFCSSEERRLLHVIEQFIGQKVPVDPEFPAPQRRERQGGSPSRRRGKSSSNNRPAKRRSADSAATPDGKPKRKYHSKKKPFKKGPKAKHTPS